MIPVKEAPEPRDFEAKVRRPGLRAIGEMVGKAPSVPRRGKPFAKIADRESDIPPGAFPPYWREVIDDLMAAYHEVCAYSGFRIHQVTGAPAVDHFVPKSQNWRLVYEWSNYRLCCALMNARKGESRDVVDPFRIRHDWFHLDLDLGFEVSPNPGLPKVDQDRIQATISRLKLNDGYCREQRRKVAQGYRCGKVSLQTLREEAPFVAYEIHRQGRLNPRDRW